MYIKLNEEGYPTGYPITDENMFYILGDIIKAPNLTIELLMSYGYSFYEYTVPPEVGEYQVAEDAGYTWENSIARQKWIVREMVAEERELVDQRKATQEEILQYHQAIFKNNLLNALENDSDFRRQLLSMLSTNSQ